MQKIGFNAHNDAETAELSQPTDRPHTGGQADNIVGKVILTSPDLSKKDAGKWLKAWRTAADVYYPNLSPLFDFYTYVIGMDNTLGGLLKKRRSAVLNKQLVYKNAQGEEVPEMKAFIKSGRFRAMLSELLDARLWGRAGIQFIVGKEFDWKAVPRKHIKTKWQVISKTQEEHTGFDYTQYWNVWIIDNGDLGELLSCSLAAAYKKDAIGDWSDLIQDFGRPTQVIWYDLFNDQVQTELDYILENAGSSLRIKLPKGTEYEQFENKGGNATGDAQAKFIDLLNKEMQIRLAGGTESTGTSKGSGHAQAMVHHQVSLEMVKEDMDYLLELLSAPSFHKVLKSYLLPVVEGGCWEYDKEIDIEYITKFKDIIKTAKELGLPITKKFVYEQLAIPQPADGDEILDFDALVEEVEEEMEQEEAKKSQKKAAKKPVKPTVKNLSDTTAAKASRLFIFYKALAARLKSFFASAPTTGQIANEVRELYGNCPHCPAHDLNDTPEGRMQPVGAEWERVIEQVYDGELRVGMIDRVTAITTAQHYFKGVTQGFGGDFSAIDYKSPDYGLLRNLERNCYQFAGAKNYQALRQLNDLLRDGDRLRTRNEFKKEARKLLHEWNGHWQDTEYNTAINSAINARKWQEFDGRKHIMPLLQFKIVGDEHTCGICKPFEDMTRPVDDPVWNYATPSLHFGDRCTITQLAEATAEITAEVPAPDGIPELFRVNLAKEQLAFPPKHPYYKRVSKRTLNKFIEENTAE